MAMLPRVPRREMCETLNCRLKMELNVAFHTLSRAVSLYYLHVTKATGARTTPVQSGFQRRGPATLYLCAPP